MLSFLVNPDALYFSQADILTGMIECDCRLEPDNCSIDKLSSHDRLWHIVYLQEPEVWDVLSLAEGIAKQTDTRWAALVAGCIFPLFRRLLLAASQ